MVLKLGLIVRKEVWLCAGRRHVQFNCEIFFSHIDVLVEDYFEDNPWWFIEFNGLPIESQSLESCDLLRHLAIDGGYLGVLLVILMKFYFSMKSKGAFTRWQAYGFFLRCA